MKTTIKVPIERPQHDENPRENKNVKEFDIKVPDKNTLEQEEKYQKVSTDLKYEIKEAFEPLPKVSLSGIKNIDSVVSWMKEHMAAFPETHGGFLVDFIDDDWRKGYKVIPYNKHEIGEVKAEIDVDGAQYKILDHKFSTEEHKMYEEIENDMKEKDRKKSTEEKFTNINNNNSWDIFEDKNIKKNK